MHLSLKGFLHTPETHHEAHQSTISAVPQTAENNQSGPPGKIHHPFPNYHRWHTAPLLLRGNQRAGAQQFPPAHYTFYRADPPKGCRLCEDASSEDIDLFNERRSKATLEEGDCNTILLILKPGCNLHLLSCSARIHFETTLKDSHLGTPQNAPVGQGFSSFVPKNPLMTRNPTNCHIVDSGKGGNGLIAIPNLIPRYSAHYPSSWIPLPPTLPILEAEKCADNAEEPIQVDLEKPNSSEELSNSRRKSSNPRKIQREESVDTEQSNHSVKEEDDSPEEESPISCLLCGRLFENRNDLRKHILMGHGIDPAEVGYPDMEMDELSIKKEQMDESEMAESMLEAETVFCCEVCIREFNDRASLWLHMLYSHREEAATACGICLRVCSDNVSLLEHVDSCHPRESMVTDKRRYSCQICARQHDSRKKLLAHVKIHNLRDADGRSLDPESMVVLNSDFYGSEIPPSNEVVMDDEFSMSCEICYKSFPTEIKLIKHKRNAHKESEAMHSLNSSATYKLYFPCEVCGLSHSTRTERWRHVFSNHADESSLVCERKDCGKVFPTQALKQEHETSHHELQGDSPNTCEICGKLWATRMNYWKHMMGVHSDCLPFICGVCLKIFCNVGDLASHVKDKHYPLDSTEEFCCDICGRPYTKKSKMSRHRKIHNLPVSEGGLEDGVFDFQSEVGERSDEPGVLKCHECPTEEFIDLEELSEHRRSAHNLVPCDLCPKYYGRTSHLWKHVYKIHKSHPDITCNICLKTSASKAHLAKHYGKHHRGHTLTEENNFVTLQDVVSSTGGDEHNCSKCNKAFRKDHLMKQHLKHCTGPKVPAVSKGLSPAINGSFPCEKCSKIFETQSLMRKHLRSSHIMYHCEICEVAKDSKTELFDHIRTEHSNHPDLTCDVESCQKMLRIKKDALKHKREHRQGYPPPTCEFCGELLPNRIKLRKHLKAHHMEKVKYMCALCTVSHLSLEDLQNHIKEIHPSSVGKPNTCAICARKCPTKYKLESHLKTHGSEFLHCLTCFQVFTEEQAYNQHCEIHPPKKQNSSKQEVVKDSDAESDNEETGTKRKGSPCNENGTKQVRLTHICVCCKSSFATTNELYRHQLEDHSGLKCETCNSFHESEEALISHKVTCKPCEGRTKRRTNPLITSLFDKSVERALRFESDDEMGGTNLSSLNSLDENSSSSKELWGSPSKTHVTTTRKVYENDESYSPCEFCEKSWPNKRGLWQHMVRSHREEAATTCGVCLKGCGSYHELDMHLVDIHPRNFDEEDSNSTCRVCGRYHNARAKLLQHSGIHTGEENRATTLQYTCRVCNMTFNSRGFLTKHARQEHNIIPEETPPGDDSLNQQPMGDSICSDDDDSQFEGFPVENSDSNDDEPSPKKFETESNSNIEDNSSKVSPASVMNSTEIEVDDNDKSCEVVISNTNNVELPSSLVDTSNQNSVSRDSFEGVEEFFSQEKTKQSSSDSEIEQEESVNSVSDVNKHESLSRFSEDSLSHSSVVNNVKSFQAVSGLNQCSRQSSVLIDELSYTNDTRYISQNMTDTEMDNFVT
ncbi:hypothetical protein J6590_041020 [Homalodisca vitripennis]|nr:hypothetical protein J6590_041020 [Homalodisca vitripennis]